MNDKGDPQRVAFPLKNGSSVLPGKLTTKPPSHKEFLFFFFQNFVTFWLRG
jgi:hypothetical protein